MQITPMRMRDYDEVCALWKRTQGVATGPSDSRENLRKFLRRNADLSQIAREKGKPATRPATAGKRAGKLAGAILCGHDGRRGLIYHLAVDEGSRRKGIGKALVAKCLAGLSKVGIRRCYIFVYASNVAGQRFWRRIGWQTRDDFTFMCKDVPAKKSRRSTC